MMESLPPRDLTHHYSRVAQRIQQSSIKKFYKYFTIPGIGNLAGGLPNPQYFPYDTLEAQVASPSRFKSTPSDPVQPSPPPRSQGKHSKDSESSHIVVPHDSSDQNLDTKIDLATSLEYGLSNGFQPLRVWIREFARTKMHPNVPYRGGPETIMTCGSTDGFSKSLYMLTDEWDDRRDWLRDRQGMLCEEFAYMTAIQAAKPRGLNVVPVAIDAQGMMADGPGGLKDVLGNWDKRRGKMPHIMYTVTTGQNPTSGVLSLERKKQIYRLCQQYDIMIIEDDPYWFLQYPSANELSVTHRGRSMSSAEPSAMPRSWKSSGSTFLDSLVPSYLSIDVDGRVIRLDTFSKAIAPGSRLGWMTAQPEFIEKIFRFSDLMTMQPSGFVQSVVAQLILGQQAPAGNAVSRSAGPDRKDPAWHMDGWIRWLEGLRGNYERRMQIMSQILEEGKFKVAARSEDVSREPGMPVATDFEIVSKTMMYDFNFPMGGMFLWMRVQYENHVLFDHPRVTRERLALAFWLLMTTEQYRILLAPGHLFCPTEELQVEKGWAYFRLCFAAVSEDNLDKLCHGIVQAANDFFDIDDVKVIDKIIKDDEDSSQLGYNSVEISPLRPSGMHQFMY